MTSSFRRRLRRLALIAPLLLAAPAKAEEACASLPPRQPMPREARPERLNESFWQEQAAGVVRRLRNVDVVRAQIALVGDSILAGLPGPLAQHFYGQWSPVNLGLPGDVTQGMLWRLTPAEAGGGGQWPVGLRPRLAVLLLGTNNLARGGEAADIALGLAETIRLIRRLSPATKVLLLGILPRGAEAAEPMRARVAQVNALLAGCDDGQAVYYAEPGPALLDAEGRLSPVIAGDHLHPSAIGYAILGTALAPRIAALMAE